MITPNKAIIPEDFQRFYTTVSGSKPTPADTYWRFSNDLYDKIPDFVTNPANQIIFLGFQGDHWEWTGIGFYIYHHEDNYYYEIDVVGYIDFETSIKSANGILRLYTDDSTILFNLG